LLAKPAVSRLERELAGELKVLRLSGWSELGRTLGARHGVRGFPTFLMFDGTGQMVHYQVGRIDPAQIRKALEDIKR